MSQPRLLLPESYLRLSLFCNARSPTTTSALQRITDNIDTRDPHLPFTPGSFCLFCVHPRIRKRIGVRAEDSQRSRLPLPAIRAHDAVGQA